MMRTAVLCALATILMADAPQPILQPGAGVPLELAESRARILQSKQLKAQEEHHRALTFAEELEQMVRASGLTWKPDYLP